MSISTWGAPLILLAAAATAFSAHAGEQTGEKHRFNMTQGGKKMSAEDFDAWMKARGVRVVGRNDTAPAQAAPQVPATAIPADGSDGGDH